MTTDKLKCHLFGGMLIVSALFNSFMAFSQDPWGGISNSQLTLNDVTSFAQDSLGYMWIATLGGLNRYNGYEYTQFTHNPDDSLSLPNDFVFSLFMDSSNRLWVGTAVGVCRYDFYTERFHQFAGVPSDASAYGFFQDKGGQVWVCSPNGPGIVNIQEQKVDFLQPHKYVNVIWEDEDDHIWMGINDSTGLAERMSDGTWNFIKLPSNRAVTCYYKDPQGILWLGTDKGVILFNRETHDFMLPQDKICSDQILSNARITFIKEIEPLKLMIGTDTRGFFLYDMMSNALSQNHPEKFNPLNSAQLHACYLDKQNDVWIGTFDKGFVVGNKQSDYLNPNKKLYDAIKDKFVSRVYEDAKGNLWIGTRYNGIYKYDIEGNLIYYSLSNQAKTNAEFLEVLFIDSFDRVWIAFESSLFVAKFKNDGTYRIIKDLGIDNVRVIKEDGEGTIWVGGWNGLYRIGRDLSIIQVPGTESCNVTDICFLNDGRILFSEYGIGLFEIDKDLTPSLISFPHDDTEMAHNIITIFEDSKQRVWLGSYGQGLLCRSDENYYRMTTKNGLPSNNTLCFEEDKNGTIWLSTSHGIAKIKQAGDSFSVTNYRMNPSGTIDQYHEKSGTIDAKGVVYFGGNHGLTFFNPSDLSPRLDPPKIYIEDLKIFNQSVKPSNNKESILSRSILFTDKVVLNHKQKMVTLDYSGIDFYSSNNLTYKYRLNGFDSDWNFVGTHRRASYSNLRPGHYVFEVCAINEEGIESTSPAYLNIVVKSSPWLTWKAWALYSLLFASLAFFILKTLLDSRLNKQRAEIEHNEKEREKDISRMKVKFFTNISHELRTPLTLIKAPLEKINESDDIGEKNKQMLNVALQNSDRMLKLINQLIDSAKIEDGVLSLKVKKLDAIELIRHVFSSFTYAFEQKKIDYVFQPDVNSFEMWIDSDKVEKILYNLLSNAVKHTPEGGLIAVKASFSKDKLIVDVEDSGDEVPDEKMSELFKRYKIINGSPDYSGNGIGLHYTKTLVQKHKGEISARKRPGGGMIFSFSLPAEDIYFDREKDVETNGFFIQTPSAKKISDDSPVSTNQDSKQEILVAEDNDDLRNFLFNLLSDKYLVTTASNGEEALEKIKKGSCDIVVSDVIMPKMSGFELCKIIKNNPEISHIPVILLTAKTTISEQMEGLQDGADAYICKPFNIDLLLLTIKNQLRRKEMLWQYFSLPESHPDTAIKNSLNEHDRNFLNELTKLISEEMNNPQLCVDYVAHSMGLSRTLLYRKVKGLTDMSPNDFIRNYRFKRSAELILEGNLSLSEIAEETGFGSYSYFSKSFKAHFGLSPKEYESKHKGSNI